jgi:hypothetical protein
MPKHVNFLVKFLQTFIMLPNRPARASTRVVGHKQAPAQRAPVWRRSEGDGVAQSEGFGVAWSSAWMSPSGEVRVAAVNPSERQRWRAGVM